MKLLKEQIEKIQKTLEFIKQSTNMSELSEEKSFKASSDELKSNSEEIQELRVTTVTFENKRKEYIIINHPKKNDSK